VLLVVVMKKRFFSKKKKEKEKGVARRPLLVGNFLSQFSHYRYSVHGNIMVVGDGSEALQSTVRVDYWSVFNERARKVVERGPLFCCYCWLLVVGCWLPSTTSSIIYYSTVTVYQFSAFAIAAGKARPNTRVLFEE